MACNSMFAVVFVFVMYADFVIEAAEVHSMEESLSCVFG